MLLYMLTAHSTHCTGTEAGSLHLLCLLVYHKYNLKYPSNYVQEEDFLKLELFLCSCGVFVMQQKSAHLYRLCLFLCAILFVVLFEAII